MGIVSIMIQLLQGYNPPMSEMPVLHQERQARELLDLVPPEVIGARIRRERLSQSLSIRDLASRANLGPNSVARLEAGTNFRPITLLKVCAALSIHVDRIAQADECDVVAIHRRYDDRWHDLDGYLDGYLGAADGILSKSERAALVKGTNQNPLLILKSHLESGQLLPTLIEVHTPSIARSHPGEEFVFVLRGPVKMIISGRDYTLDTGESLEFWGTEPHSYAPAKGVVGLILSVRAHTKGQ